MSEQPRIELAFSRPRFAIIIGTVVVTGLGLLAAGSFAGIEVGSVQARAAIPEALPETPAPLPLQFAHELPVIESVDSETPDSDLAVPQQQYEVQAASFRSRGEAAKLAGDLTHRGYSTGIGDFTDRAGHSWSIVFVGPYAARDKASQVASELVHLTHTEPIIRVVDN